MPVPSKAHRQNCNTSIKTLQSVSVTEALGGHKLPRGNYRRIRCKHFVNTSHNIMCPSNKAYTTSW